MFGALKLFGALSPTLGHILLGGSKGGDQYEMVEDEVGKWSYL